MEKLQAYFQELLPYTNIDELVSAFSSSRLLDKHEHLVKPGQKTSFMAFINRGAFRVYFYNENGDEITTWFSFEGRFVTDLLSYYKGDEAIYYVQAIEDSEIFIAQKEKLEALFAINPDYREFGRKFAENGMVLLMERMVDLQTKTATQRYIELLEQPQFLEKIPLKYLATYLGVTDTSLSRIRKNIADQ